MKKRSNTISIRQSAKIITIIIGVFILFLVKSFMEGHIENYVMALTFNDLIEKLSILFAAFFIFIFIQLFEGHFEETIMNVFEKIFGKRKRKR